MIHEYSWLSLIIILPIQAAKKRSQVSADPFGRTKKKTVWRSKIVPCVIQYTSRQRSTQLFYLFRLSHILHFNVWRTFAHFQNIGFREMSSRPIFNGVASIENPCQSICRLYIYASLRPSVVFGEFQERFSKTTPCEVFMQTCTLRIWKQDQRIPCSIHIKRFKLIRDINSQPIPSSFCIYFLVGVSLWIKNP